MSERRKAKAAARRAAREQRSTESIEKKPLVTPSVEIDEASAIEKPQEVAASSLRLQDLPQITPAKAMSTGASGLAQRTADETVPTQLPSTAKLEAKLPQGAQQMTPTNTLDIKPKVITISDMLEGQRRKATQDKTDAVKMQKYYALTDALKSLGQMGATAVGGAIGGNVMDSATVVPEYKPNRGYIDAFEKAKQANDRLRNIDEKEFQLNYNKELRDEERAYQLKLEDARAKLRAAEAAQNHEYAKELRQFIADLNLEHDKTIANIKGQWELDRAKEGQETVRMQMSGKDKENEESPIPFTFHDLTKVDIPRNLYPELIKWALSKGKLGEDLVDEDNVDIVLRRHPEIVNSFLNVYGLGTKVEETPVADEQTEEQTEEKPKVSFWQSIAANPNQSALKVQKIEAESKAQEEDEYSSFKRAKK